MPGLRGRDFRPVHRTEDLLSPRDSLHMDQETLFFEWESENRQNEHLQFVMPISSVPQILHSIHDRVSGGHLDILELPRQLPNFEKDFTGPSTRMMSKTEFV